MASTYSVGSAIKVAIIGDDKLSKQMDRIHSRVGKFGQKISSIGIGLTKSLSAPLIALGGFSTKSAMDINKSVAEVMTLTSGGIEQAERFKKSLQELSIETAKDTGDLSKGLYQVISALGEGPENMQQLRIAARAAVAGVSETKEAVDLLQAAVNSYADSNATAAEKIAVMQKASDIAFKTVKMGVTTFPELSAAMGSVFPLAAQLDTSMEDLFATLIAGTKTGANTSEITTQMASAYSAFLKPTKEMQQVVKKLGYESATAMMKEEGLGKSMQLLSKAVDGNEGKLAKLLKRKEALLIGLTVSGKQAKTYAEAHKELKNRIGATDEAVRKQTEGINKAGFRWEQNKKRMMVFAQRIGDRLLPVLEKLFDRIEPWLKKLENMDDATIEWYMHLAKIAIVAGPVLTVFGKLIVGVTALHRNFSLAKAGATGIANSINLLGGELKGLPYAKMSKTSKFLKALQGAGAVLGAGAGGFALGTMVNEALIAPHSEKQAKRTASLEETITQAQMAAKGGDVQAKLEAHKRLSELYESGQYKSQAMAHMKSVEGAAGALATPFTGGEAPAARAARLVSEFTEVRKQLTGELSQLVTQVRQQQVQQGKQSTLTVQIKDETGRANVKSTGDKLKTTNRGLVMDGI